MKILWVNSSTTGTLSNTRLFGMPPVFNRWGDESLVLIGGRRNSKMPEYFITLPIPLGSFKLYRLMVTLILPLICFRHKPDVLLSDWMSAQLTRLVVFLRKLGLLRCKLVHDVRTVPVREDQGKSYRIYSGALKFARRHFDGVTTISEPLRDEICREFGFSPDVISVWTSGVDLEHFRPQDSLDLRRELGLDDKFVVFYHGAVSAKRGVIELAQAVQYLGDIPGVRLLIVGGGNQWMKLRAEVMQKKLDQVILKPGVPYAQIPGWIALADLCVVPLPDHPWWRVSSPLKIMEYLAAGKPILLTEMKAHRAVIPDDDDAFYVARAEAEVFAEGIRRAIAERGRFAEMGERGRRKAEADLTWEKQAKVLRNYLVLVLKGEVNLRSGAL